MTKSPANKKIDLSVIVLNYNANQYLRQLYDSIVKSKLTSQIEVILADNASTDDSFTTIQSLNYHHPNIIFKFHSNTGNVGFAAGNNQGLTVSNPRSRYVLFINPDTTVEQNTFQGMINYFDSHPEVDAATCDVILAITGQTQPECHRGFPTPWNAFCYFFLPFLPNGYIATINKSTPQLIDCCVGAFIMIKRQVGKTIGWWNEKYFMYGEDIDICYQIKKHGFKLFFIPQYQITHHQGVSSGIKKQKTAASRETKSRSARATTNAMRIFYRENLIENYPPILQFIVWRGIDLLEFYRVFKAKYL